MTAPVPARAAYLDLFKTLLIWGMVAAHVVQLLGIRLGDGADGFSIYVNLISFSGYMLAFGLGIGLSRGDRRSSWQSRARPVLVMLAAVYISSFGFALLQQRKVIDAGWVIDLLSFRVLFGYSEFLASFLVVYIIIALARTALVAIAENTLLLAVVTALCLLSTAVTTDQFVPLIGTLIGHRKYASFPLIPYLPWFLVGIRLGRRDGVIPRLDLALALVASGAFVWMLWRTGWTLPERFPPSILWIVGPALILAIYLVGARALTDWVTVPSWLLSPGRHVLAALLVSNLVIFTIGRLWYKPVHSGWMAALVSVAILAGVTLWCWGIDWVDRRGRGGTGFSPARE